MSKRIIIALFVACALAVGVSAQKAAKSWTEWSKKDAEKMLNDSPWGQTQTDTDTSEMFYTPGGTPTNGGTDPARDARGQLNQATGVKYRIRFFSARPIRQALARSIELSNPNADDQLRERLRAFTELNSNEWIIVTATFESNDGRYSGIAMQAFNGATTATLKNNTYLERRDGKRVFIDEYGIPGKEGFGARFVFPRMLDGQPFITPDSGDVRFYSEIGRGIKLNMKFKVDKMMYDGKLEY
ncbi:MAG TPA: hypothetical protein VJT82_03685 [Pyrinomonadaceae bacterium]|nr:hypothetical protein [Pyrinomonadaceae bacterium]